MAPVAMEFERRGIEPRILIVGQSEDLLRQVLPIFPVYDGVVPVMLPSGHGSLSRLERVFCGAMEITGTDIRLRSPDVVLVHGDTATTHAAMLAAFYEEVPIAHVEAGLRSGRFDSPFPEEFHRVQVDRVSDFLFAPTAHARDALLQEPHRGQVFVTGNTELDAVRWLLEREEVSRICGDRPYVVVTAHRRENQDDLDDIREALTTLAAEADGYDFVFPAHPTPKVQAMAKMLAGIENIRVVDPLPFDEFIPLVRHSRIVLTDSGGLQEDGAFLNVPVLIMRDTTERPEAIEAGSARLVGTETDKIVDAVLELIKDEEEWQKMSSAPCPFGTGHAAELIVDRLEEDL